MGKMFVCVCMAVLLACVYICMCVCVRVYAEELEWDGVGGRRETEVR